MDFRTFLFKYYAQFFDRVSQGEKKCADPPGAPCVQGEYSRSLTHLLPFIVTRSEHTHS